jgi:hypothetical protein
MREDLFDWSDDIKTKGTRTHTTRAVAIYENYGIKQQHEKTTIDHEVLTPFHRILKTSAPERIECCISVITMEAPSSMRFE